VFSSFLIFVRDREYNLRKKIAIAVVILIVIAAFLLKLRYPGKAQTILSSTDCKAELWNHVYEKERLRVRQECVAIEGRVVSMDRSSDGDLHIGLDADDRAVLNFVNVVHNHGELVVEVICEHPPDREAAKSGCVGFQSQVPLPSVGERVRVVGAYVTDLDQGWNEIHPVTRIEKLPR